MWDGSNTACLVYITFLFKNFFMCLFLLSWTFDFSFGAHLFLLFLFEPFRGFCFFVCLFLFYFDFYILPFHIFDSAFILLIFVLLVSWCFLVVSLLSFFTFLQRNCHRKLSKKCSVYYMMHVLNIQKMGEIKLHSPTKRIDVRPANAFFNIKSSLFSVKYQVNPFSTNVPFRWPASFLKISLFTGVFQTFC